MSKQASELYLQETKGAELAGEPGCIARCKVSFFLKSRWGLQWGQSHRKGLGVALHMAGH